MKLLVIFLIALINPSTTWSGDFTEVQKEAKESHKLIVINFSGSDWCGPCIRLRKEILESASFEQYAQSHLLLVRADFPRQKKNKLNEEQVKRNEALAEKYNPEGKFPYTVLVDENGKVLKDWDGYPNETAQEFVAQVNQTINAGR